MWAVSSAEFYFDKYEVWTFRHGKELIANNTNLYKESQNYQNL